MPESRCRPCIEVLGKPLISCRLCPPSSDGCLVEGESKLWWLAIAAAKCANTESPQRRWDCIREFQYEGCQLWSLLNSRGYRTDYKHTHLHLHLWRKTRRSTYSLLLETNFYQYTCLHLNCLVHLRSAQKVLKPVFDHPNPWTAGVSGWISESYCGIKPLWLGMWKVVPARTSLTLHPLVPRRPYIPHPLPLCINCRD